MKVVVLGASGLLGSAMFRVLSAAGEIDAIGAIRSATVPAALVGNGRVPIRSRLDVLDEPALSNWLEEVRPEVVINCVGLVKQRPEANDEDLAMAVNAELPHRLAAICKALDARLIHFSTDCVFSGREGQYTEASQPDCTDLYGCSKLLGEVRGEGMLTLRTSMIGPELNTRRGLLGWFQGQSGPVKGYTNMVFSGPTSLEIAQVVRTHVLPARDLSGLYHLSTAPITKFDLLHLIGSVYGHRIDIEPDGRVMIDRSLDSSAFQAATNYVPPDWPALIRDLRDFSEPLFRSAVREPVDA
jgi:dTDP-4-dehydrorhamnose reductase